MPATISAPAGRLPAACRLPRSWHIWVQSWRPRLSPAAGTRVVNINNIDTYGCNPGGRACHQSPIRRFVRIHGRGRMMDLPTNFSTNKRIRNERTPSVLSTDANIRKPIRREANHIGAEHRREAVPSRLKALLQGVVASYEPIRTPRDPGYRIPKA